MKKTTLLLILFLTLITCKSIDKTVGVITIGEKPVLLRQPYLQMIRPTTATITWKTDSLVKTCFVEYKKKQSSKKKTIKGTLVNHEGNTFNEVIIEGLKPETKYYYSIYSNGHMLASGDDYFFTTAPKKEKEFTFYALGDIGAPAAWSFAEKPAIKITELAIKPDFGLGLGDIVYPKGESKNYDDQLFKPFEEVFKNTPFYPVPGNHDWYSDPEKNFEKEWALPYNEHYYSFSYSNALFIGLDSSKGEFYEEEKQLNWLKNLLKENNGKYDWIIVYLHHNGKTCTYKPNYKKVISLYEILANNNVDLVLNGHAHTYERLKPYDKNGNVDLNRENETSYKNLKNRFISVTVGAGGKLNKNWKADPTNKVNCKDGSIVAHYEHVPSFALISIDKKVLKLKGINSLTGTTFDEIVIKK
jgi:hypothetical protein